MPFTCDDDNTKMIFSTQKRDVRFLIARPVNYEINNISENVN